MEKRPGRFEVDVNKTMRIGTDIYREIIKKMLSVHIASMERKMRACQRCPPRCPALPEGPSQEVGEHPYTKPYKDQPFIPRAMLPSYIQLKLAKQERKMGKKKLRTEEEAKTREEYEAIEDKIREHKGVIAKAKEAEKDARVILQAQIDSLAGVRGFQDEVAALAAKVAERAVDESEGKVHEHGDAPFDGDAEEEEERLNRIEYLLNKLKNEEHPASVRAEFIERLRKLKYPEVDALEHPPPEDLGSPTTEVPVATGAVRSTSAVPSAPPRTPAPSFTPVAFTPVAAPDFRDIVEADAAAVVEETREEGITRTATELEAEVATDEEERGEAVPEIADPEIAEADDDAKEETAPAEETAKTRTRGTELVEIFVTTLAGVTGTTAEKKAKRSRWKKAYSEFLNTVKPNLPAWAEGNLWQNVTEWWKQRKKLVSKMIDNPGRDDIDEWRTALTDTLRQPQFRWLFAPEGEVDDLDEFAAPPRRPGGFTSGERGTLNQRLGENWMYWVDGPDSTLGTTANEFIMVPFPKERFHEQAKLLIEANEITTTKLKEIEEIESEDPNFLMRMQLEYYELCTETEAFTTLNVSTIDQFVAHTETTAKARDRLIWEVPAEVQQIPEWPGALLEVEVFGPDFVRCPVWKNSHARHHLDKGRRFKATPDHGNFKAQDAQRYDLREDEYVEVTMSWPMGVPQHFECYCYALKGDSETTIYIPGDQLRKPTAEEKKDTDFFDLADDVGVEEDDPTVYQTPSRARSASRESYSSRVSIGSYYNPGAAEALSRLGSPVVLPLPADPYVPHIGLLPVHSPEVAARAEVPPELHNIVDSSAENTPER